MPPSKLIINVIPMDFKMLRFQVIRSFGLCLATEAMYIGVRMFYFAHKLTVLAKKVIKEMEDKLQEPTIMRNHSRALMYNQVRTLMIKSYWFGVQKKVVATFWILGGVAAYILFI
uniref:Uncharacterized protein n=1 Tax=Clastoptera arizonana TaxID=38151 RepID=A0A1B6BXN4_9HEMI